MTLMNIIYFIQFFLYYVWSYNLDIKNSIVVNNFNNYFVSEGFLEINRNENFLPDENSDNIMFRPPLPGTWDKNPKMITISPGGIYGFYTLGTCAYIKENYDMSEYIFSGASAGSWNSLYMVLKNDLEFSSTVLNIDTENMSSIFELEYGIKNAILSGYKTSNFDLERIYIGVTVIKKGKLKTTVYCDFKDLKDAIDCCIASSHIPFITGGALNRYKDLLSFDGGFSKYPYVRNVEPILHITPNMWNKKNINCKDSTLFNFKKNKHMIDKLFVDGYNDALIHKEYLDSIFEN